MMVVESVTVKKDTTNDQANKDISVMTLYELPQFLLYP